MRAWIEIAVIHTYHNKNLVALFMRAWIEIAKASRDTPDKAGRPLHEGVD